MEQQDNDFEMEVSRLPSAGSGTVQRWRSRRLRSLLVAGLVGVVVLALAVDIVGQQQVSVFRALFSPAATATLSVDQTVINVAHWAPWGKLLANGRVVSQLSTPPNPAILLNGTTPTTSYVTSFALPRGRYTLEYFADPFPALHCHISVPAAASDDCPLAQDKPTGAAVRLAPGARMLDLHAVPEYLPSDEYRALGNAIGEMLATAYIPPATLRPGDHYLNAQRDVVTASVPLTVSANLTLSPDLCVPYAARGCTIICAAPLDYQDLLRVGDNILYTWMGATAQVQMAYRYTTLDGQVALDNGPISAKPFPGFTLPIAIARKNGSWRVVPQNVDMRVSICSAALNALNYGTPETSPGFVTTHLILQSSNWTDGCMLEVANSFTGPNDTVSLLYRFGTLLALSPQAHQLFSMLPLASPHEQLVAAQAFSP
jgi:hypothetical protein